MTFTEPVPGHWETPEGIDMANTYAGMKREDLAKGKVPDLVLANGIYLVSRDSLDLMPMQTAAKERIRWLSVQLALANARADKAEAKARDAADDASRLRFPDTTGQ